MDTKLNDIMYMTEIVRNFLDMNGCLSLSQYKQFWSNLGGSMESTTCYMTVLLVKFIALEVNAERNSNLVDLVKKLLLGEAPPAETKSSSYSVDDSPLSANLRQALLNTLYFLGMFYAIDRDYSNFKAVIGNWVFSLNEKTRQQLDNFFDDILKLITSPYLEGTDAIISLVDQCSNIDFSTMSLDFEKIPAKQLAPGLINYYLRQCLLRGQQTKSIFDNILLFLKHPLLSEKRMLSLLHMLKHYVILSPYNPVEVINLALSITKNYYLWPRPYGDVARDVLQLLTIELKSPGAALRKVMIEENPDLVKGTPKSGKERTVHVLLDQGSKNGRALQELLKAGVGLDVSIQQIQLNLLAHILSNTLSIHPHSLNLEYLSKDDALKFYEVATQILNEAVLMNQEDAEQYRMKQLTSLKEEIVSLLENVDLEKPAPFMKPKIASTLPPLNFQFLPVHCDNNVPMESDAPPHIIDPSLRFPKRPSFDVLANVIGQYAAFANAKNKPVVRIGIAGGDSFLHNVLCSYIYLKTQAPKSFDGLEVQFYLIPTDPCNFAAFLARFDGWYGRHVCFLPRSVLRTYPSVTAVAFTSSPSAPLSPMSPMDRGPGGPSADQIKAKTWTSTEYDKTVAEMSRFVGGQRTATHSTSLPRPVRQGSVRLRTGGDSADHQALFYDLKSIYDTEDLRPPSPSVILRSELENYFREAKWKLDVNTYRCECWGDNNVYVAIPFCQRAEIGLRAYAKFVQQTNDLSEATPLSTLQQHKAWKFAAPSVSTKYTQMNVLGVPRQGIPIDARSYLSIVISNIPMLGDRGVPPNPTKPWLEMCAVEADPKKKKGKPSEKDLDQSSLSTYHVSMVDLESDDKKKGSFHVLLDNVLYGPFNRIRITPCLSGEDIVSVPFMTYFPLDMPS